ncbi:conserved hypothetical protein [Histoplasma capsulatum H143]|uniref:Uncharacterized protein n=1 Tax=Ajellomyces capsulatus (strain H143) TaxID=544712 RepID=C6HNK9_AJECH|nr:conserved hypothetical protein [Histoplasma capsulatum H143]
MNESSTTLMTFLVSVKLFGSWDNFTRAYPMEKDSRIGRGHWKGCHTFTNIICDGETKPPTPGRNGGLRMGGTYWYYYQLDNEIDFFNEAEPVTTSCALLPGQPLNVLNVPINLPSSHTHLGRGTKPASQISNDGTMNPADKYLNPRAPPRPVLLRLTTSPAMLMRTDHGLASPLSSGSSISPVNERSFSHPRALATHRRFRIGSKLSLDLRSAINHSPKTNSLRSAILNFTSPRFGEGDENRGRRRHKVDKSHIIKVPEPGLDPSAHSSTPSPTWSVVDSLNKPLPHPYVVDRNLSSEYASGNQFLAESQGSSTLKAAWTVEHPLIDRPGSGEAERNRYLPVDAYPESMTSQRTPRIIIPQQSSGDISTSKTTAPLDLYGKALPSLPHSPSSIVDAELPQMETVDFSLGEEKYFQSHFSDFTVDSPDDSNGGLFESALTDLSAHSSSLFDIASNPSPQPNVYINNAHQDRETKSHDYHTDNLVISSLYISKSPSREINPWTLEANKNATNHSQTSNDEQRVTPPRKGLILKHSNFTPNTDSFFMDDNPELLTPRANCTNHSDTMNKDSESVSRRGGGGGGQQPTNLRVESTMQELMDELSYLGDMIEDNAVKSF